jgi:hypothetical protein
MAGCFRTRLVTANQPPQHTRNHSSLDSPCKTGSRCSWGPLGVVHSLPTSSDTHLVVFPIRLEQIRALHNLRAPVARTLPDLHCRESPGQLARPTHLPLCSGSNYILTQDSSTPIESNASALFLTPSPPISNVHYRYLHPPTTTTSLDWRALSRSGHPSHPPSHPIPSSSPTVARGLLFPPEIAHLLVPVCTCG